MTAPDTGLRPPPHSIEAEHAVLGAVLNDNAAFSVVGNLLRPEHFYAHVHARLWQTIAALIVAGKPADVVTVFEARPADAELGYINQLAGSVVSIRHVGEHARIVLERWRERQVVAVCWEVADRAMRGGAQAGALIDDAVTRLMALQAQAAHDEPVRIDAVLPDFVDDLNDRAEGKTDAYPTSLADLDRLATGGMRGGELWVIGARPSMGKTALTLALSRSMSADHAVLMLTQEDSINSLVARHVAAEARVNLSHIRMPKGAPQSMWTGVTEAVDALSRLRLYLDDQPGLTLLDVRRKVQQVKRRDAGLRVVIVDYLQLMEGEGDNRNLELGRISNGLKKSAKELDVTVVLLSQLNREADKRSGPPQMSDLRDSGDIEGAADLIGLLHREYRRKPTPETLHWAQLHVAKNKNGPTDTLNLWFDGETQQFGNWDGPAPRIAGKGGGD